MSGTIISTPRPTSSTSTSRGCAPRSTRVSSRHCCTRCAAPDTSSVTSLGRLARTTAFKLIAAYLIVFAIFAASVIAYLGWHTQRLVISQATEAIENESRILDEQYKLGGINRLVSIVNRRSRAPGAGLYLLTTFT